MTVLPHFTCCSESREPAPTHCHPSSSKSAFNHKAFHQSEPLRPTMKHKDGIKCYLKPRGLFHDERKFREIPQEIAGDDDLRLRCVVLKTKDIFSAVFKFSENFEMYSASALHAVVAVKTAKGAKSLAASIVPKGHVYSGMSLRTRSGNGFTFSGWKTRTKHLNHATKWSHYNLDPAEGDLLISVRRGHPEWIEGPTRDYTQGPAGQSTFRVRSFVPLPGKMGDAYIFQFTPQTPARYHTMSQRCLAQLPMSVSTEIPGYTADPDFGSDWTAARALSKRIREEGKPVGPRTPVGNAMSDAAKASAASVPLPEVNLNDDRQGASVSGYLQLFVPAGAEPGVASSSPKICTCPKLHQARPGRSSTDASFSTAEEDVPNRNRRKSNAMPRSSPASLIEEIGLPETAVKRRGGSEETIAKQCTSCKNFKAPPVGKKITYRRAKGKYMCVPRNARDEAGPENTVAVSRMSTVHASERQIVEQNPTAVGNITNELAPFTFIPHAAQLGGTGHSGISRPTTEEPSADTATLPAPVESEPRETGNDETGFVTSNPAVGEVTQGPATSTPILDALESDSGHRSGSSQPTPEDSTVDALISFPSGNPAPRQTGQDDASNHEPNTAASGQDEVAETKATNQPGASKRPAEPSNEQPPAKLPRIEESTVAQNGIHNAPIKTEPEINLDIQAVTPQEPSKTRRELRLEDNITRRQRQLKRIELEEEIEELQRQLATEQRRKQNATPVIHVKQEIIKID
ncbi:hypothetical protein BST61_g1337 [Cercospora zeina]